MRISHHYITLITPEKLEQSITKRWKNIVEKYLPNGVEGSANILVNGHQKQSNFYIKKINNKLGGYVIPLTRDLTEDEVGLIAVAWNKAYSEGDFIIDFSQSEQSKVIKTALKDDILNELSTAIAKKIHSKWINTKVIDGWSYGPKFSKIHHKDSKLLPWEQCSKQFKLNEINKVKTMFAMLESLGFNLVRKD